MDPNLIFNLGVPALVIGSMAWRKVIKPYLMSRTAEEENAPAGMGPVYIPVSHTSMETGGMERDTPDIDALNTGMPRLSRDITIEAEIAFLAVIRNPDKSYRHSANKIAELMGGDRNTVLATVKAIRSGPEAEPITITPIAGRPTRAQFETEPGLRYEPPPR